MLDTIPTTCDAASATSAHSVYRLLAYSIAGGAVAAATHMDMHHGHPDESSSGAPSRYMSALCDRFSMLRRFVMACLIGRDIWSVTMIPVSLVTASAYMIRYCADGMR